MLPLICLSTIVGGRGYSVWRGCGFIAFLGRFGNSVLPERTPTIPYVQWHRINTDVLPPLADRVDTALQQFALALEDKGEHIACLEARKHFAWYLRGVPHSGFYKEQISNISAFSDIERLAKEIKRDLR